MTQRVKFLVGFRGIETSERFYAPGEFAQLSDETCSYLVLTGKAKIVLGAQEKAPAEAPEEAAVAPETGAAQEAAPADGSDQAASAKAQTQAAEFLAANPVPEPKRRGRR